MSKPAHENCLRMRSCHVSNCRTLFFVCKGCDRGQRYCSQKCREESRRQQKHEANSRYQRTERGKLAHLLRQRAYRRNVVKASVTDQGCRYAASSPNKISPLPPRCIVCTKENKWIDPFDLISPRRWNMLTRNWFGISPKNYGF